MQTANRLNRIPRITPTGHPLWRRLRNWLTCRRLHLLRFVQAQRLKVLQQELGELYRHMQLDMAQAERNRKVYYRDLSLQARQANDRVYLSQLLACIAEDRTELARTAKRIEALQ